MLIRYSLAVLLFATATYGKPVQTDASAVNSFLSTLAAGDSRTDSLVTLDYQNMASRNHPDHDNAKNPLFTSVDKSIDNGDSYSAIANLLQYYQLDCDSAQNVTTDMTTAINRFMTIMLNSSSVQQAWTFLQQQGVSSANETDFTTQLYNLWFLPYARNTIAGSSGFKSVFFGEASGTSITRFANWYGFYHQELSSVFNYHGWLSKDNAIAIELQFTAGNDEDVDTAFILNSSPEFEFAAYTVVALTGTQATVPIEGNDIGIQVPTLTYNGATVLDQVSITIGEHSNTKTTKHHSSKSTQSPSTDADLQALVDKMWNEDDDKPTSEQVTMDWGSKISGKSGSKNAPLFTTVDEKIFEKSQYADLITTYDKDLFTADVCTAEAAMSGFRKQYLQAVFDTFTATPMFQSAFQYIKDSGYKETTSLDNFKTKVLWPLWFGVYTRCKGPLGSSGWEHVFSGEIKGSEVDGQHDWVRYYKEQQSDHMVYDGYYTHDENLIGTFQYKWNDALKPKGGFFTGTSPAFDFSILSVCALLHGNGAHCHFNVNGYPITVTSYLQDCGDGSGTCLATAYPG